ncbi:MAG: hypothetical protein MJK15_12185 [Colwellia sp.]|nr:hypothetical protein [Colwellia sp.]
MNKYLISPFLIAIFLQGCGGSSSSTPDEPIEPVDYNFSLTAKLTNACGIASGFTEVELLLQDETWQTIKVYQPDENGEFSFITNKEFINYTLVAKDQQGSEAQGLNVVSYYQASSATPAHYQAQFDDLVDNSSCECVTQDLKLTHRPFSTQISVTSSSNFDDWTPIDESNTLFTGVQVCGTADGNWPLHSFSVAGIDANKKVIAAAEFMDDFTANGEGVWTLSAFLVEDTIDLVIPHQVISTNQLIRNTKHFANLVAEDDKNLLIFDVHPYISEAYYQSQASVTFVPSDSIFRSSVMKNKHQMISTSVEESLVLMAGQYQPAFNEPYFDEINADGSYDYSAVAGYPMAIINFTFTAYDPVSKLLMPAQWTFYGAEKGVLAISAPLTGYEDIINLDSRIENTNVRLIKTSITNNYHDYIKHYQGKIADELSNDFVKDITEAELNLKF